MQRLCCCSPDSDSDEEPKYWNIGEQKKQIKPYGLFGYKSYEEVVDEIWESSDYGHLKGWDLMSVIVKSGENIYQEKFAS